MDTVKVLIADDYEPVRKIWKRMLNSDERIEIISECSNGQEIIDALKLLTPDVVLLDINMSPVNGFEASAYIKKNFPYIKVLGISVHNDPLYITRLLEVGANGFIPKSAKKAEMIKAILSVHNGANYVQEESGG